MANTAWAVLLCKFNDDLSEPFTKAFAEQLFTKAGKGTLNLVDFFADVSYGAVDVGDSKVFDWLTLPHPHSDYVGSGVNLAGRTALLNWARQAAGSAGINLKGFFKIVVVMNVGTDLFGGEDGVVTDKNNLQPSILGQEMGHGYGLDHSRLEGSLADYSDRWDVMSTFAAFMAPNPNYGLIGPFLNAANMDGRGWLASPRRRDVPLVVSNLPISIRPLSHPELPGFLAARIGDYLVEFRLKERWDAAIPRPTVLVHRFADNHSYLQVATSGRSDLVEGDIFRSESLPQVELSVQALDIAGQSAVMLVTTRSEGFDGNEAWTNEPYYGTYGTFFADVTGDGRADAIVVNADKVVVRRNTGNGFGPNEAWTHEPYYGTRGMFFADVTGDGRADAIVVNDDKVVVRRNTGDGFGPNEAWTHEPYYGTYGTFFADVTGDGRADAIVVGSDKVVVRRNTGNSFGPNEAWTHEPYFGSHATFFADVTGDGRADAIVVNDDKVVVRRNTGTGFGPNEAWTSGPYYGTRGMFFVEVTGDGRADAIVVNDDKVVVRRSRRL